MRLGDCEGRAVGGAGEVFLVEGGLARQHVTAGCCCRCPHCPVSPQELSKRFSAIRKTKGDGNCFYRALGYSYLESLLGKSREVLK